MFLRVLLGTLVSSRPFLQLCFRTPYHTHSDTVTSTIFNCICFPYQNQNHRKTQRENREARMFYSQCLLSSKGPLGAIWVAAYFFKKLKKTQIAETNISSSVGESFFSLLLIWVFSFPSKNLIFLYFIFVGKWFNWNFSQPRMFLLDSNVLFLVIGYNTLDKGGS